MWEPIQMVGENANPCSYIIKNENNVMMQKFLSFEAINLKVRLMITSKKNYLLVINVEKYLDKTIM